MTRVRVPLPLRGCTGGAGELPISGSTVGDCLQELERRYPAASEVLREDSGPLLPSVNLYVNGQDVRYLSGLETPLGEEDELAIVIAIAGGEGTEPQRHQGTKRH